jgi:hypothetical protein
MPKSRQEHLGDGHGGNFFPLFVFLHVLFFINEYRLVCNYRRKDTQTSPGLVTSWEEQESRG